MQKSFAGGVALAALACASLVMAQGPAMRAQSKDPISDAFRRTISGAQRNLLAGAQIMPEEKYSFKPTPEQMSFGAMALHVAQSDSGLCARATGAKAPSFAGLTPTSSKADLVAAMKTAFDFCDQAMAKLTDADMSKAAPALVILTDDLGDHYSQESIYLRINGHLPPTAMRGNGGGMRGPGGPGGMRGGRGMGGGM